MKRKRTKRSAASPAYEFAVKLAVGAAPGLSSPAPWAQNKTPAPSLSAPRTSLSGPDPRMSAPKPLSQGPAALPKPVAPAPTPIQQELKLRQSAIAAEQSRLDTRARLQYGDWWAGKNQSPTGRAFGQNVAYPVARSVADASNRTSLTLKNMGARGASLGASINQGVGAIGDFVTMPKFFAPQDLTGPERADYSRLQDVLSTQQRELTPGELQRIGEYDQRQTALNQEKARQDYWRSWQDNAYDSMKRIDDAGRETTRMIEEGISPNAPRAGIVTGPDGRQSVQIDREAPLDKAQRELGDAAGQNSLASRIGNTALGFGDLAAQQAPVALATAGAGNVLSAAGRAVPALQTSGQMLNPSMGQILPNTMARIGAGVGAGVGALNAVDDIANAKNREEQIAAGRGLAGNMQAGMALGGLPGAMLPSGAATAPTVAAQAATAAPGRATTLGTYGAQLGQSVLDGAVRGAHNVDAMRDDFVESRVAPDPQILNEQPLQAGDPTGAHTLNTDLIPPAFHAAASRANAGLGSGVVGSDAVLRPGETENTFKVVPTEQDADFYRYLQESGTYRTADGKPGNLEPKALQAGQAAFDTTLTATGSQAKADQAREAAYKGTYVQAYRDEQRGQYDTSREELADLLAKEDAAPQAVEAQFDKTLTHLARSNPENAAQAKNFVQETQQSITTGAPLSPQAQAFENNARQAYVADAAAKITPPAGAQNNPQAFGSFAGGLIESFNGLPTEAKAAIGIGLPLALVGMLMSFGSEEGGGLGLLLGALGLGVAGIGAAGSGMLGDQAQQMVGSGMRGVAGMFGAQLPEKADLSPLLSQDVIADINKQIGADDGGGSWWDKIRSGANAAVDAIQNPDAIKAKLQQVEQVKQLTSMPSFLAIPLLRSLDPEHIKTTEQAQQAYDNALRIRRALDNPESPLAKTVATGQRWFGS